MMRNRALPMHGERGHFPAIGLQPVVRLGRIHDRGATIGVVKHPRIVRGARLSGTRCCDGLGFAPVRLNGDNVRRWCSVTQSPCLVATPLLALGT